MSSDRLRWLALDAAGGLRAAVVTVIPFYLAARLGRPELSWMALGGWLGSLADPGGPRSSRAAGMAAFAMVGSAVVALTLRSGGSPGSTTLLLAVFALFTSLPRVLGGTAANLGTLLLVLAAVAAASPGADPARAGSLFLAGAVTAVLLSSILWPVWAHLPVRLALARVYAELSAHAASISACARAPALMTDANWGSIARQHQRAVRAAIEDARAVAVASRSRRTGESAIGANLRMLLGESEAAFFQLIALGEELATLAGGDGGGVAAAEALAMLAQTYTQIHDRLIRRALRRTRPPQQPPHRPLPTGHASELAEALLAASRAALFVASDLSSATGAADDDAPRRDWLSRIGSQVRDAARSLRDTLVPGSFYLQHAVRVACTVSVAFLVGRLVSPTHAAWVTVTAVAVLQPYPGTTRVRAAERVIGTALGSIAVLVLMVVVPPGWAQTAVLFPLCVAAIVTRPRSYRLFTFFLTPVFVLTADHGHAGFWTAATRAGDAVLGGGIALLAGTVVMPSWERRRLGDALALVVSSLRAYAEVMFAVLEHGRRGDGNGDAGGSARLVAARRALGIAIDAAETSLERMLAEPRRFQRGAEDAMLLITYSRRLAGALTALDVLLLADERLGDRTYQALAQRLRDYVGAALSSTEAWVRRQAGPVPVPMPVPTPAFSPPDVAPWVPVDGLPPALASAVARLCRRAGLIGGLPAHAAAAEAGRVKAASGSPSPSFWLSR